MTKKRTTPGRSRVAQTVAAAAGAAGLVAGAGYLRRRRTQPSSGAGGLAEGAAYLRRRTEQLTGRSAATPKAEPATWNCECGQEFRVSGRDRHRLYWLPDAPPEDPLLDDRCPACERELSTQAQ